MAPPAAPDVTAQKKGCARNALIGCGVAALVLFAVCVAAILYLRRNPTLLTDFAMRQIESHYGPSVTEQDKADLRAAYADFRTAVRENRVDKEAARRMQTTIQINRGDSLSQRDIRELARTFRAAAGKAAIPPSSPSPSSTP